MTIASANLNPILAHWIGESPVQTAELDCGRCEKRLKCCDFQPFVANFLLGAILEQGGELPEPSPRIHLQPLGLMPTKAYRDLRHGTAEDRRGEEHLCVFFNPLRRSCNVWKQRPGECSTYLCVSANQDRLRLSERAFEVESTVSQMALLRLGLSLPEVARQIDFLNEPEHGINDPPVAALREIYRAAWEWARGLSRDEVTSWIK